MQGQEQKSTEPQDNGKKTEEAHDDWRDSCLFVLAIPGIVALATTVALRQHQGAHKYWASPQEEGLATFASLAGLLGFVALPTALLLLLFRTSRTHWAILLMLGLALLGQMACIEAGLAGRLGLLWTPAG